MSKLARNDPKRSNKQVNGICYEKSYLFDFKYQFKSKPEYSITRLIVLYNIIILKLKTKPTIKYTNHHANRGSSFRDFKIKSIYSIPSKGV